MAALTCIPNIQLLMRGSYGFLTMIHRWNPQTDQRLRMPRSGLAFADYQQDSKTNCRSPLYRSLRFRLQYQQSGGYSSMFSILSGLDLTHSALHVNTGTDQLTTRTTLSPITI